MQELSQRTQREKREERRELRDYSLIIKHKPLNIAD
jgi:hypothetical protein